MQKLSGEERERVVGTALEAAAGRVPVFVGASREGTDTAIAAAVAAERAGAAGAMIAPPTFLQPGPALTEHCAAWPRRSRGRSSCRTPPR